MSNETQMYQEAIEVLMSDISRDLLVREIAKHEPSALVAAAKRLGFGGTIEGMIVEMLKSDNGYIEAIKMVREQRSMGLKQAKDYVDQIRDAIRSAA
jgi:ribosomal protein L7/L12